MLGDVPQSSNTQLCWVEKTTTTIPWNLQPKSPEVEGEPNPVAQHVGAHPGGKERQQLPALFPLHAVSD